MGGGDKCLRPLAGRPLLAHAVERAERQVGTLLLNANGEPERFAAFALPIVADSLPGFLGPLAGVLAAIEWTSAHRPSASWVVSFATDAPFFPLDLAERLHAGLRGESTALACAASAGQVHPVFGLWPVSLGEDLRRAMLAGERKIDRFTARHGIAVVTYAVEPFDPFFNVNNPEDLAQAELLAQRTAA
ncbi:MAG: molybdenum cofactor guanylyltransferase MobA [Alphaproteobacteria bacterium]|nr:molybdenum cofactor guanylyltransferase MobA [Alphaproteobacteria bacterium]